MTIRFLISQKSTINVFTYPLQLYVLHDIHFILATKIAGGLEAYFCDFKCEQAVSLYISLSHEQYFKNGRINCLNTKSFFTIQNMYTNLNIVIHAQRHLFWCSMRCHSFVAIGKQVAKAKSKRNISLRWAYHLLSSKKFCLNYQLWFE